jgi:hypothetical protein
MVPCQNNYITSCDDENTVGIEVGDGSWRWKLEIEIGDGNLQIQMGKS